MKFPEIKVVTNRVCEDVADRADSPQRMLDLWQRHVTTASWFDPLKEALVVWLLGSQHTVVSFHLSTLSRWQRLRRRIRNRRRSIRSLL